MVLFKYADHALAIYYLCTVYCDLYFVPILRVHSYAWSWSICLCVRHFEKLLHCHFMSPESGVNCKVEAEECDTYEEGNEEPVAMIEESPPDIEQDGQCNLTSAIKYLTFWV